MRRFGTHPGDLLVKANHGPGPATRLRQAERIQEYHRRALDYLPDVDRLDQCSPVDSSGTGDGVAGEIAGRLSAAGAAYQP